MSRNMPLALQKRTLVERFVNWNPGVDVHEVDWRSMDAKLSYDENLKDLRAEYPQYSWGQKAPERDQPLEQVKREAVARGYTLVRTGTIQRREARDIIRRPGPRHSVKVRLHWRRAPGTAGNGKPARRVMVKNHTRKPPTRKPTRRRPVGVKAKRSKRRRSR